MSGPNIPYHTLHRRIGRGTYGEVWLATDAMDEWCAVKVVSHRQDTSRDHGYHREFNAIKRYKKISHSHGSLIPILTVGRETGDHFFYYSMELADDVRTNEPLDTSGAAPDQIAPLIEGYQPRTLRAVLEKQRRLPPSLCLEYGIALATALEQLHTQGLIHRDIKPDNIIFVHGRPKLADVGLVADVEATYSLAGTTAYLSPEPERREPADIFALGKVLYEMATGREAEEFPAPAKDLGVLSEQERTNINELNSVFLKACDPDPQRRQGSARQLREELELLNQGGSVLRQRKLEQTTKCLWLALKGAAVVLLVAGLGFGYLTLRYRAAEENRRVKLREIQISRMHLPQEGWFTNYWARLKGAAAVRKDQQVLEQASALLAGLDVQPLGLLQDVTAASAAFAPDGRVLISGLDADRLLLVDTNGGKSELPVRGAGPVCWPRQGPPLQLIVGTNGLLLREALTGQVRKGFVLPRDIDPQPDHVTALDLTPDGTTIAATLPNRLLVWKATTGELLGDLRAETATFALSPDGSLVGTGSMDGTIRVYGVPGLEPFAVLPPALRGSPILCLAFSRDPMVRYGTAHSTNSWLLAAGDKGAGIVIWDLERRLPRTVCRGATWHVSGIAFSPDGVTLATAGRNMPMLWDGTSGQKLLRLDQAGNGEFLALAFDTTGQLLVCGGERNPGSASVAVWQLQHARGIQALRGLASSIRKVWFAGDRRRVAALSDDWHLAICEVPLGRLVFLFETPVGILADNAAGSFDAAGDRFAFATGQEACIYDLHSGGTQQRWKLALGLSDQLRYDGRGRLLLLRRERASPQLGSAWRLYELGDGESPTLLHEQSETNWLAEELALAPGGERFLAWNGGPNGAPRVIRAYDARSGRELWKSVTQRTSGNSRIWLDPTGQFFAYNWDTEGKPCRVVRFSNFQEVGLTPKMCQAVGPTGREFGIRDCLAVDGAPAESWLSLATDWQYSPDTMTFSADGKALAWGSLEGVVLVADIQEVRRRLAPFRN
jgi:hypothetical protein